MPSTLFPPGPAHIAIGPSTGGSMTYLGTTQSGVQAREILFEGPIQTDYGGLHGMPADVLVSGKNIVAVARGIRMNPAGLALVRGRYYTGSNGYLLPLEMSTLLLAENATFQVMILSQYQGKGGLYSAFPPGLRLAYAYVKGELGSSYSTNEQLIDMTFYGLMKMIIDGSANNVCWDNNMTGFPAII